MSVSARDLPSRWSFRAASRSLSLRRGVAGAVLLACSTLASAQTFEPGDVYVGSCGGNVYRYEAATGQVSLFASTPGDCATGIGFNGPNSMLVLKFIGNEVVQFDSAGNGTVVLDASDGLLGPYGQNAVAIDRLGRLYFGNSDNGTIVRTAGDYSGAAAFADFSDGIGRPEGLAFSAGGDLFVANRDTSGQILRITPDGTASVFDTVAEQEFYSIAIRNNGDLYAASNTGSIYRYGGGLVSNRVLLTRVVPSQPSIAFNDSGSRLYQTGGTELRRIDPDTGEQFALATFPEDVIGIGVVPPKRFRPGDIYVGSCADGAVYRVDPASGSFAVVLDANDGLSTCATGITFRRGGGMLVSSFGTSSVIEFDECFRATTRLGPSDGVTGPYAQGPAAQDARGNLYFCDWRGGEILRCDSEFRNVTVLADSGDGLVAPEGLQFLVNGDLLCVDRTATIKRIAPDGTVTTFDTIAGEQCGAIALRNNNDLYVATHSGAIYRYQGAYAASRTLLATYGSQNPSLAFSSDSTILYHQTLGDRILRQVDPDNGAATELTAPMPGTGSIGVVPPPSFEPGRIYLATCGFGSDVILEVNPGDWSTRTFAEGVQCGSAMTSLRGGRGMLASSYYNDVVYHVGPTGLSTPAIREGLSGPLGANGIVQDSKGRIYVSQLDSGEILRYDEDFTNGIVFADSADGVVRPDGLALDQSGNLYVANRDSGGEILVIKPDGSASVFDTVADENFVSIAFRRSTGEIYAASGAGRIYRYSAGDAASRALLGDYGSSLAYPSIAFDLPETTLYMGSYNAGSLSLVDPSSGARTVVATNLGYVAGIHVAGLLCPADGQFRGYGTGVPGSGGITPALGASGDPGPGGQIDLEIRDFVGGAGGVALFGFAEGSLPGFGGTIYVSFGAPFLFLPLSLPGTPGDPGAGDLDLPLTLTESEQLCGISTYWQILCADAAAADGIAMTNGLEVTFGNGF